MIIYPAIDIKDGKCVRLTQGKFDDVNVYSDDPVSVAKEWVSYGANFLHMVDLDGAREGNPKNLEIVYSAVDETKANIQFGGGIRNLRILEDILQKGVYRCIIGTSSVTDPKFLKEAVSIFGNKIAVGIDAKDGIVAVDGWETLSKFNVLEFAKRIEDIGVTTIIYTDISKDGMLSGPNVEAMHKMVQTVRMDVIASGGVSSVKDLEILNSINVKGVIIGKALYAGTIDIKEALSFSN